MKLQERSKHQLLSLFVALMFALTMYPNKAQAQIVGDLEADIPFQFHAGDTKFPAGKYSVHLLDDADQGIMEIASADGSISALFQVQVAETGSAPGKSELIFDRYGNRYFLAKLFDEGRAGGDQVIESRYERRVGQAAAEGQEHVPAYHRRQPGN
jgi:hypothetical protein